MTIPSPRSRARARTRAGALIIGTVIGTLGLLLLGWYAYLWIFATEGDIPEPSAIHFPDGTTLLDAEKQCASGGCWAILTVRPAADSTPEHLKGQLERAYDGHVAGTPLDPRTVTIAVDVKATDVVVRASYWINSYPPLPAS